MAFECKKCGTCCTRFKISTTLEGDFAEFRHFFDGGSVEEKDTASNILVINILKKCAYLGDDNLCTIYEHRPKLCREYKCHT